MLRLNHRCLTSLWGDYAYGTALGKTLIKHLTDKQIHMLIDADKKVAHTGEVPVKEVYKLNMDDREFYKEHPTEFRSKAERIL